MTTATNKTKSVKTVWASLFPTPQGPVVTVTVFRVNGSGQLSRRNYSSKGLEVSESRRSTTTARILALLEGVHNQEG